MQKKLTNPDAKENKRTSIIAILDQLTNHPMRWALVFVFIILLLTTVVPALFVNVSMQYYNNSNLTGMHATISSNFIIAFVTLLSAVFTLIYVILTRELVLENRKMLELQTTPSVFLFIEPRNVHNDITDLFIQNIGMGAAFNIRFEVLSDFIFSMSNNDKDNKPLVQTKYYWTSNALIIKDGIKYLAPTQKKQLFSTSFKTFENINLQNNLDNVLRINVKYEDYIGREKEEYFIINFYEAPANGMEMFTKFEREHITNLKEINEAVKSISENIKNLKCNSDE